MRDNLKRDLEWEMSGVPDKDILLAPIDLTHWDSGQEIPRVEQRAILDQLREWLAEKKTRSDLARPTNRINPTERCVASGCDEPVLIGSAYCGTHFDDTLLRK